MDKIKIAIFVSGEGTNCENIIRYFQNSDSVETAVVVSNKADARALTRARNLNVPATVITGREFRNEPQRVLETIEGCDMIILAGFLLYVPDYLIERFPNRIINIHPSLLPKFGGKGMWGHHVHEAVKAAGETVSGITIHYVNKEIDSGEIIAQFSTPLMPDDTPDDIAARVHELEMKHFPEVIERVAAEIQNGNS